MLDGSGNCCIIVILYDVLSAGRRVLVAQKSALYTIDSTLQATGKLQSGDSEFESQAGLAIKCPVGPMARRLTTVMLLFSPMSDCKSYWHCRGSPSEVGSKKKQRRESPSQPALVHSLALVPSPVRYLASEVPDGTLSWKSAKLDKMPSNRHLRLERRLCAPCCLVCERCLRSVAQRFS